MENKYVTAASFYYFWIDFHRESGYCRLTLRDLRRPYCNGYFNSNEIPFGAAEACLILEKLSNPSLHVRFEYYLLFVLNGKKCRVKTFELDSLIQLLLDYVIYSREE